MHPGWADTHGVRTSIPDFHAAFSTKLRSPGQGADTVVWLALEEAAKLQPGAFYLDRQPQPKDMRWAGTRYTLDEAMELYKQLLRTSGQDVNEADERLTRS